VKTEHEPLVWVRNEWAKTMPSRDNAVQHGLRPTNHILIPGRDAGAGAKSNTPLLQRSNTPVFELYRGHWNTGGGGAPVSLNSVKLPAFLSLPTTAATAGTHGVELSRDRRDWSYVAPEYFK